MLLAPIIDLSPLARILWVLLILLILTIINIVFYFIKLIITKKREQRLIKFLIVPPIYIVIKIAVFAVPALIMGGDLSLITNTDTNTIIFTIIAAIVEVAAFVVNLITFKFEKKEKIKQENNMKQ